MRNTGLTITDHGPEPRDIQIDRAEKCYDVRDAIPDAQPVSFMLLTLGRGTIHLACPAVDVGRAGAAVGLR